MPNFINRILSPLVIKQLQNNKAERLDYFRKDVILGDKAKATKEILGAYIDKIEDDILQRLSSDTDTNINMIQYEYKAALEFEKFIADLILRGELAEDRSNRIKNELRTTK